jgi:hypothetical protein
MSGIQDFIGTVTQSLGVSKDTVQAGTGGLLALIKQHAGDADFGKLAAAIPGVADLAKTQGAPAGGAGIGGMLGGLAQKAGGLLGKGGGGAGALAALAAAGLGGDKAATFLKMFVDFLKSKVPGDLLKTIAAKVPGLAGLTA